MKYLYLIFFLMFFLNVSNSNAQVENVIVETYYVSDEFDSTDFTGGKLDSGSVTYRIYVDLPKDQKLLKIYGDKNHIFKIKSTDVVFNNKDFPISFSYDECNFDFFEYNTVALDSWLTIGQTSMPYGNNPEINYFGVLKSQDIDGSFIGGVNNDGGSKAIARGLLSNTNPLAGIPLTQADGMAKGTDISKNNIWYNYGVLDFITKNDTTIFGSIKKGNEFVSHNFGISNSGTVGVDPEKNQILIGQITTKGKLSFELNLEIEQMVDGILTNVKYVANDSILETNEKLSPFLRYPFTCGCQDANYMEYKSSFACSDESACKTKIVYGCMDTMACNFDPSSNFMIKNLCCYPGMCNDRDISIVCPEERGNSSEFEIHPNPTENNIFLNVVSGESNEINYTIYNSFGVVVLSKNLGEHNRIVNEEIDLSSLNEGIYHIRLLSGNQSDSKTFIKK
jgi:hypothetical protein